MSDRNDSYYYPFSDSDDQDFKFILKASFLGVGMLEIKRFENKEIADRAAQFYIAKYNQNMLFTGVFVEEV